MVFVASAAVGDLLGPAVGLAVGTAVGDLLGPAVGLAVGTAVGDLLGPALGLAVGTAVGDLLGPALGLAVGTNVGAFVGPAVGLVVGTVVVAGILHQRDLYRALVAMNDAYLVDGQQTGQAATPAPTTMAAPFAFGAGVTAAGPSGFVGAATSVGLNSNDDASANNLSDSDHTVEFPEDDPGLIAFQLLGGPLPLIKALNYDLEEEVAKLKGRVARVDSRANKLSTSNERMRGDLTTAKATVARLEIDVSHYQGQIERLENSLGMVKSECESEKARLVAKAEGELENLQEELKRVQELRSDDAKKYDVAIQKLEGKTAELELSVKDLTTLKEAATVSATKATMDCSKLTVQVHQLTKDLNTAKKELNAAKSMWITMHKVWNNHDTSASPSASPSKSLIISSSSPTSTPAPTTIGLSRTVYTSGTETIYRNNPGADVIIYTNCFTTVAAGEEQLLLKEAVVGIRRNASAGALVDVGIKIYAAEMTSSYGRGTNHLVYSSSSLGSGTATSLQLVSTGDVTNQSIFLKLELALNPGWGGWWIGVEFTGVNAASPSNGWRVVNAPTTGLSINNFCAYTSSSGFSFGYQFTNSTGGADPSRFLVNVDGSLTSTTTTTRKLVGNNKSSSMMKATSPSSSITNGMEEEEEEEEEEEGEETHGDGDMAIASANVVDLTVDTDSSEDE
jgi:hypothetical protein